MKKTLLLALLPLFAHAAFSDSASVQVYSEIDNLYVPHGFDDNDVVEVVMSGHFPSSCYQLGEVTTVVDEQTKTVRITPYSYRRDGELCIEMLSPYTQVVKLGKMSQGSYKFVVDRNPQIDSTLTIEQAQVSDRDDFLYPPVDFADVVKSPNGAEMLVVKGRYPLLKRGCMKTEAAKLDYQEGDMLVVQPKASVDLSAGENGTGCTQQYEKKFRLPYDVEGKVLLHVRAINGQSYNRVIEVGAKATN